MSEDRTSTPARWRTRPFRLQLALYVLAGLLLAGCSAPREQPDALATRVQRAVDATVAARTRATYTIEEAIAATVAATDRGSAVELAPSATLTPDSVSIPAPATAAPVSESPCPYVERAAQAMRDTQDALNAANNGGSWAQARRRIAAVQSTFSALNEPSGYVGSLRVEVVAALTAAGDLTRLFEAKQIDETTAGRFLSHQSNAVDLILLLRERYGCN